MSNRDPQDASIDIDAWGPTGPSDPAQREKWLAALAKRYTNGTLDEVLVPEDADMTALFDALRNEPDEDPSHTH